MRIHSSISLEEQLKKMDNIKRAIFTVLTQFGEYKLSGQLTFIVATNDLIKNEPFHIN